MKQSGSNLPSSAKKRRFELASQQLIWSCSMLNLQVHACRLAALDASLSGASLLTCMLQCRLLWVTSLLSNPYASAASSSKRSKHDSSRPPKQQAVRHSDTDAGLGRPSPTAVSQEASYQALPQELLLGPLAKALQVGAHPVGCFISSPHPGRLGRQGATA